MMMGRLLQKKRPPQPSRLGSGVRFQPGAAVDYSDLRWPGHIVAVEDNPGPTSPRTPFPSAKRCMHCRDSIFFVSKAR